VIPESVRRVIESGRLAHLVTLNRDGSPQLTAVWVGIEGDEIVTAHLRAHQKVRNMRRDPRVVLSMETGTRNSRGLDEYLVVHGTARLTEGGAPDLLNELAQIYIGPGTRYPPMDNPPAGFITRIRPERYGGVGPWMT
jgi:PPOX class probable F420-dependent enzyme